MSPSSITIDVRKVSRILEASNSFISPVGLAGYLNSVANPHLTRVAKARFKSGGDSASGKWAALSQATQEIRENLGYPPNEINVRTGKMREFLINPSPVISQDAAGTTMEWPGTPGADLNKRLKQAAGRGRGPARWIIAYDTNTVAYILSTLETWAIRGRAR